MAANYELREEEFERISSIIHETCGINLHDGKKELVRARLTKRLRKLDLPDFREYLDFVESDENEFVAMVDSLCTNLTTFFREPDHFDYLVKEVFPSFNDNSRIRIWSAGCSSGEEAYTLAILLNEYFPGISRMDCLVLATDISTRTLETAQRGVYTGRKLANVPGDILKRYFKPLRNSNEILFEVEQGLRTLIKFRYLNLMSRWPMKKPFDVIMCRNVMIYFDKITQRELVARFYDILKPGGIFMAGHSESLTGIVHNFKYVRPSIYQKP